MSVNEHYQAVLADLIAKREPLLKQADELMAKVQTLNDLIDRFKATMGESVFAVSTDLFSQPVTETPGMFYKHISMRWAILRLLSDHAKSDLMPTADIAQSLIDGGFPFSANFNSKVSAILSQMFSKGEVGKKNQDWCICPHGQEVWESIKKGDKYANRHINNAVEVE